MEQRKLTCIGCPMGCLLSVDIDHGLAVAVHENQCAIGARYGISEINDPRRTLTTTLAIAGAEIKRVSAKSTQPLKKQDLKACYEFLKTMHVDAPVECGEILVSNINDSGIDIIATKQVKRKDNISE